jgi:centrin-3
MLVRFAQRPVDWKQGEDCAVLDRVFSRATFQAVAGTLIANRDPKDEARRAFKLFDVDGKGLITAEDLSRVCRSIGNNITDSEVKAMIDEFDAQGRGGVNEEEFVRLMTKH